MFDIHEIQKNVPHRFPFLLIDRVLEFDANTSVKVLKNVSINEGHFQGHFPGQPIMPGVLIVEHMAQAACFLLAKSAGGLDKDAVYYLGKIKQASFRRPAVPGDQLKTIVTITKQVAGMTMASAETRIDDQIAAKCELMLAASKA